MKKHLYIDFHILQTLPPSCVNRDDTGSPKTAIYGGVTRARVSSQAWKHAMRNSFLDDNLVSEEDMGKRTKKIIDMIACEIEKLAPEADSYKLAQNTIEEVGIKSDEKGAKALFFMSKAQARALAELAVEEPEDKKDKDAKKKYKAALKEALRNAPSVDMALFGRMVADDPSLNYDAAAQVAHSISTHAVQNEYDYFTAVDDCAAEDNAGAGHLGTSEYNSATVYRYATVNALELLEHLGAEKVPEVIAAFGEAFIKSMPTGKQNSYANRTLPDAIYITVREDQPINLCGAFEKAISKSLQGYMEASKKALEDYALYVYENFAENPAKGFVVGNGLEGLGVQLPVKAVLAELKNTVADMLSEMR